MKKLQLQEICAAATTSTSRCRALLFILTGASIIAFAAEWKVMRFSWHHSRLHSATAALDYLKQEVPPQSFAQLSDFQRRRLAQNGVDDEESWQAHLKHGMEIASARGFVDREHARAYLNALEQELLETMTIVRLPIFGVTFDVNDLGMFAGIAFVVLLVTLRLGLVRELQNLRIALEAAYEEDALKEGYAYLSMSQVLSTPPKLQRRLRLRSFFVRAPMLLVWLPFLVQLFIFGNDLFTMKAGAISSPGLTMATLLVGFASLFIIFMVTYMCWHMSAIIDHEWSHWCKKANAEQPLKNGEQSSKATLA